MSLLEKDRDFPAVDEQEEQLIDALMDDLGFMANTLGIETVLSLQNGSLIVSQEAIDKTTTIRFFVNVKNNAIEMEYLNTSYSYCRGMLEQSYKKAKAGKEKESVAEVNTETLNKQTRSVFDSVIKIVRFNRSEEKSDGN